MYSLVCFLTLQGRKIPSTIIEGSSSHDSSGSEKSDHVENDESDEVSGYIATVNPDVLCQEIAVNIISFIYRCLLIINGLWL